MAITKLHLPSDIAGQDFRRLKGQYNDLISERVLNNKAIYYDPAASDTTDGSGDIDLDLTTQFSGGVAPLALIVRGTGTKNYTFEWDDTATAGHLKFRVIDADAGTVIASTAINYLWIATGTPA